MPDECWGRIRWEGLLWNIDEDVHAGSAYYYHLPLHRCCIQGCAADDDGGDEDAPEPGSPRTLPLLLATPEVIVYDLSAKAVLTTSSARSGGGGVGGSEAGGGGGSEGVTAASAAAAAAVAAAGDARDDDAAAGDDAVPWEPLFVVLASDGVWDVVSNDEACRVVAASLESSGGDWQAAAAALARSAIAKGSTDNATALVLSLCGVWRQGGGSGIRGDGDEEEAGDALFGCGADVAGVGSISVGAGGSCHRGCAGDMWWALVAAGAWAAVLAPMAWTFHAAQVRCGII